jgi:hypothetical protein
MKIRYTSACYVRTINRYKGYIFTINNVLCIFSLASVLLLISGRHCQYRRRNVRSVWPHTKWQSIFLSWKFLQSCFKSKGCSQTTWLWCPKLALHCTKCY